MRKKLICTGLIGIIMIIACYMMNFGRLYIVSLAFVTLKIALSCIDAKCDEKIIEEVKGRDEIKQQKVIMKGMFYTLIFSFCLSITGLSFHYDNYMKDVYKAEGARTNYCKWTITAEAERMLVNEIYEHVTSTIVLLESGIETEYDSLPVSDSTKHTEVAKTCELANKAYTLYMEGDKQESLEVIREMKSVYSTMWNNCNFCNDISIIILYFFFCILVSEPISDSVKYSIVRIRQRKLSAESQMKN